MERIETLIRGGKIAEARQALVKKLPGKKQERLQLANWSRRLFQAKDALRLLHRQARPPETRRTQVPPEISIEYAASLIQVGAILEAEQILKDLAPNHALATFQMGFLEMRRWNALDAKKYFSRYLESSPKDTYLKNIAQVNLAASLQQSGLAEEASSLLERLLRRNRTHQRLKSNLFELLAQTQIASQQYSLAAQSLDKSQSLLNSNSSKEALWIRKWRAILELKQKQGAPRSIRKIRALQSEASTAQAWEVTRDLDFHLCLETGDREVLRKLLLGTPFKSYKNNLTAMFTKKHGPLPKLRSDAVEWNLSENSDKARCKPWRISLSEKGFKPGQIPFRLLEQLCSDFYAPLSFHFLFSHCYPDYFFVPHHSQNLFHQGLSRCRQLLKLSKLPLQIVHRDGFYYLNATKPVVIEFNSKDTELRTVQCIWGIEKVELSTSEIATRISASRRSTQRKLKELVEQGLVKKTGSGPTTRYSPI